MIVSQAWVNELRDERGRWTSGGNIQDKIRAALPSLQEGVSRAAMVPYHRPWQEHPNQLARSAQLLDLWSQADHWPADAFRDHFLSHMDKQSLSEALRDGMRQLAQAKTQPEIDAAGYQLGRAIGVYGPDQWAKDTRLLPDRARRALDPQGLPATLAALNDPKQRTELEWNGLGSLCSRSIKAPVGFEKPALDHEYCLVVPKPAAKPAPKPEGARKPDVSEISEDMPSRSLQSEGMPRDDKWVTPSELLKARENGVGTGEDPLPPRAKPPAIGTKTAQNNHPSQEAKPAPVPPPQTPTAQSPKAGHAKNPKSPLEGHATTVLNLTPLPQNDDQRQKTKTTQEDEQRAAQKFQLAQQALKGAKDNHRTDKFIKQLERENNAAEHDYNKAHWEAFKADPGYQSFKDRISDDEHAGGTKDPKTGEVRVRIDDESPTGAIGKYQILQSSLVSQTIHGLSGGVSPLPKPVLLPPSTGKES